MESEETSTFDDPQDAAWIKAQCEIVTHYLAKEGVKHNGVATEPEWFIAPHVAVWAIRSVKDPDYVGWWAISGDLPTDYMTYRREESVGEILIAFATRWREAAKLMAMGKQPEGFSIGGPEHAKELAPLLTARAKLLYECATEMAEDSDDSPSEG